MDKCTAKVFSNSENILLIGGTATNTTTIDISAKEKLHMDTLARITAKTNKQHNQLPKKFILLLIGETATNTTTIDISAKQKLHMDTLA